jgi:hypothetical protein
MRTYAVIMQLPDGKMPGFYAQVIKALAGKAHVFDREKEILIVEHIDELLPVEQILDQYKIPYELVPLLHIPDNATLKAHYEDFGFTTKSGNTFLYEDPLILFSLEQTIQDSDDYTMALMQLEEHILASFKVESTVYYAAEKHLEDCFYGIAKAYQCTLRTYDPENGLQRINS